MLSVLVAVLLPVALAAVLAAALAFAGARGRMVLLVVLAAAIWVGLLAVWAVFTGWF